LIILLKSSPVPPKKPSSVEFVSVLLSSVVMRVNQFDFDSIISQFKPFQPIVSPEDVLSHAIIFVLLGFVAAIIFVAYEVTNKTNKSRSLLVEFSIAGTASVLVGVGALFSMLAAGLNV
jgi:hypothetical protein